MASGDPIRVLSQWELEQALKERVKRPCPMCDATKWEVSDKLTVLLPLQDDLNGPTKIRVEDERRFWVNGIPTLALVCCSCGFIAPFRYEALSEDTEDANH